MSIEAIELFGRNNVKVYADRPKNISSILEPHLKRSGDKVALVTEDKSLTYETLNRQATQIAAYLQQECHVVKGDRVATIIGNRFQFPLLTIACAKIGAVMVPVNVKLSVSEMEYIIGHADIKVLWYEKIYEEKVETLQKNHENIMPMLLFNVDEEDIFLDIIDGGRELVPVNIDEKDGAYLLYTSGTTGRPKGALISHINVIHSLMHYQKTFRTEKNLRTLIAVPMFHVTGLVGQLLHLFYIGVSVYSMEKYQNKKYIDLILKYKINFLFNIPTIFIMMSTEDTFLENKFEFVEKVAYGGAPIYQQTYKLLKESFPNAELHNAYGSTETTSPVTLMPIDYPESKITSVGKALPTGDIKILDEKGDECPVNEIGELAIKGPMVIKEYWRNPEANKRNFTGGYWLSGDLGYKDKDGFYYIRDRKKDMINRAGEKIFSIEVEDVLKSHLLVNEAAVVGVPDEVFGERVKAIIVAPRMNEFNLDEIKNYCLEKLAKFKVPEIYEFLDELPRNASGKILKSTLK